MTNFGFLKDKKEYVLFGLAAIETEKVYVVSPAMCTVGCRKALELAVKWVYSTDNTMLNAIDQAKTKDGSVMFTPAHFDLIIIDESHRNIFKKYRAVFEYFGAIMVGLTATPKTDVDRNTYDFF